MRLSLRSGVTPAFAVLALALSSFAASPADDPPLPAAEEVLHKVLTTVTNPEVRHASAQFRYVQRTLIEKTDDKGRIREREERVYDVGPLAGGVYASLVEKNGKSLTSSDLLDEKERRQRFLERSSSQRFGGGDSDRVPLDPELFNRYRAEVLGREWKDGRSALILRFWPRSADLPVRRRQDYVLNKLTGKVWVDEQDWEIVKVDAHLTERVRVMLGLVAALDKADLSFEQLPMGGGVYLPLKLTANFEGRKLFSSLHQRVEVTWTGQRPAAETATNPAAPPAQSNGSSKPHP